MNTHQERKFTEDLLDQVPRAMADVQNSRGPGEMLTPQGPGPFLFILGDQAARLSVPAPGTPRMAKKSGADLQTCTVCGKGR